MESGFGGVIFHEACGHLLETTSVAKRHPCSTDKMGQLIATPRSAKAVDGGLQGKRCRAPSTSMTGMATQHTQLIGTAC